MLLTFIEIFMIGIGAGVVGSILGLGGEIIVVPALTLCFGMSMRTAVAASTVAIIATSTGAAVAYLRDRLTNTRVAIWLEMGTSIGALSRALVAGFISQRLLFILFGLLLSYSSYNMFKVRHEAFPAEVLPDTLSRKLKLTGSYYDKALGRRVDYQVTRTLPGLVIMYFSGAAAGLLGIGAGIFKVEPHPALLPTHHRLHGRGDDLQGGQMVVMREGEPGRGGVSPIELVLARLLRIGSICAAGLLAAGIAGMLLGQTLVAPRLINAGLIVLLGTPVMRVVAAAIIFVRGKEWHFALFSLVVLIAIAAGICLGRG